MELFHYNFTFFEDVVKMFYIAATTVFDMLSEFLGTFLYSILYFPTKLVGLIIGIFGGDVSGLNMFLDDFFSNFNSTSHLGIIAVTIGSMICFFLIKLIKLVLGGWI